MDANSVFAVDFSTNVPLAALLLLTT